MKVRDRIRRLIEPDRENAEVAIRRFDRSGAVTVLAARETEFFDRR
jgi:hypothetical protein